MSTNAINSNTADAGKLAFDANALNDLKLSAKENSPDAIKGVAKQFEAIFMNMMLKSMRDATPHDSPFDSEQSRQFTSMLDQQLTSNLSSKGLGLSEVLTRQLSKTGYPPAGNTASDITANVNANINATIANMAVSGDRDAPRQEADLPDPYLNDQKMKSAPVQLDDAKQAEKITGDISNTFQDRMSEHAEQASRATGVPANYMLGQAALESGWGKREIKGVDGTPSNNLFGIKATGNWTGKVVEAATTEYVHGVKQQRIEKFRAYDSYADSFKDFANMMRTNQRYDNVMSNLQNVNDYARAMQNAGYATDPNYAIKLAKVIQKVNAG